MEFASAERGDWFITGGPGTVGVCQEYTGLPSCLSKLLVCTIKRGTYIGPVHSVTRSETFVTVEVPSTHALWRNTLVFVNVASFGNSYARRVTKDELNTWAGKDWRNQFLDEQLPGCDPDASWLRELLAF